MAYSRYSNFPLVDDVRQATFKIPVGAAGYSSLDLSQKIKTVDYTVKDGDRLDAVAARLLGRDDLWPIIAIINNIKFPLGSAEMYAGRVIKVPVDAQDVKNWLI